MSLINTFNGDNFSVIFSNIPLPASSTEKIPIGIMNNYVKTVTLPDYNLEVIPTDFGGFKRSMPVSKVNNDLTQLTIDFKVDEDGSNYHAFFDWMVELRHGRKTKGDLYLHTSNIKTIEVIMRDNQKRERSRWTFKECMLVGLSSLSLEYGSGEEVIFTTTLNYDDFTFVKNTSIIANN